MKTGRPPKPTLMHKLHNTRPDKKRVAEPQPVGDLDAAPQWLTSTQREGWEYAIRHAPPGLLKPCDRGVLVAWVEAEDRHREATIALAEFNRTRRMKFLVRRKNGALMVSPLVEVIDKAARVMLRAASDLGFSPVARPRLAVDQPAWEAAEASANPFSKFSVLPGGRDP